MKTFFELLPEPVRTISKNYLVENIFFLLGTVNM